MFFRVLVLGSVYLLGWVPLYGATHHHYHRYAERLNKKYHNPARADFFAESHSYRNRSLFSPLQEILRSNPFHKGISISKFSKLLQDTTHSQFSVDCSLMPQWFHPKRATSAVTNEKYPSWQLIISPTLATELYNSHEMGSGTIEFSYTSVQYWRTSSQDVNSTLGVAGGITGYPEHTHILSQLTFTQIFPKEWLSVCVGQYSLYSIDGTLFDNDQQTSFVSYALSQNASATYSYGSFGAYVQLNPCRPLILQAGMQDAYNISGKTLSIYNLTRNRYNFHGYISWHPECKIGTGHYSCLVYATRKVPEQPTQTMGWSINVGQYFGKMYAFGRYNGATGKASPLNRSYVIGLASADPLCRNHLDFIGAAYSISKVNHKVVSEIKHHHESVAEALLTIGFGPYVALSSNIQVHIHPASRPDTHTARIYGIRANLTV